MSASAINLCGVATLKETAVTWISCFLLPLPKIGLRSGRENESQRFTRLSRPFLCHKKKTWKDSQTMKQKTQTVSSRVFLLRFLLEVAVVLSSLPTIFWPIKVEKDRHAIPKLIGWSFSLLARNLLLARKKTASKLRRQILIPARNRAALGFNLFSGELFQGLPSVIG
jgi:hypothetical protein